MKALVLYLSLTITSFACLAQQTIEVTNKFDRKTAEVYNVLKSDMKTKEGLFQVRYNKTVALASGMYHNNVRTGVWHFFDQKGTVLQNYDYDNRILLYEAPEVKSDFFQYKFYKTNTDKDTVTRPVKLGGRFYGYQGLLRMFKKPPEVNEEHRPFIRARLELLVSPYGNLADYTILVDDLTLNVKLDLIPDNEKKFIPATFNREPIASTIIIPCVMKANGTLLLFSDLEWKKEKDL